MVKPKRQWSSHYASIFHLSNLATYSCTVKVLVLTYFHLFMITIIIQQSSFWARSTLLSLLFKREKKEKNSRSLCPDLCCLINLNQNSLIKPLSMIG